MYVLVVGVNVFDLQFKFIHKSSSRVCAHLKKLTKLRLYLNLCFALDLQRKYETWSEWELCKSEDTACYATGTRIRKRDCLSETDPQIKVNHCVGPPTQKDWCQMPCKGNTIIWICLNKQIHNNIYIYILYIYIYIINIYVYIYIYMIIYMIIEKKRHI